MPENFLKGWASTEMVQNSAIENTISEILELNVMGKIGEQASQPAD